MKLLASPRLSRTPRPSRTMALMAAILMFVLIAAAVTAMMTVFTTETRRTRTALASPQLRQFLLAGATLAQTELAQHGTTERDVPLPLPLPAAHASLHIAPDHNGATVRILATYHNARASQLVHLTRSNDNTWTLASAELHD